MPGAKKRTETLCLTGFGFICLTVILRIMLAPAGDLDEIWNYNISRAISMGYIPYRDFSLVQTPLWFFLASLPLHIARKMIVYRMFMGIMACLNIFCLFRNAKRQSDSVTALLPASVLALFFDQFAYNNLTFLCLMTSVIILNSRLTEKSKYILTGIIAALSALGRQTTGGLFLIALTILLVIRIIKPDKGSEDTGKKDLLWYLTGVMAVCIIFAAVLIFTGSFASFWEYCLFSLFSFGKANSSYELNGIFIWAEIISILAALVIDIRKKDHLHMIVQLCIITVAFPIFEPYQHLLHAFVWSLIPVCNLLVQRFRLGKMISVIISAMTVLATAAIIITAIPGTAPINGSEFSGIPDNGTIGGYKQLADRKTELENRGYKVYMISSSSSIVSILADTYTPHFDLFLEGNLGLREPLDYVVEIIADPDTVILISSDYDNENWQNPDGIYEYVTQHCVKTDEIGHYEFYTPVS